MARFTDDRYACAFHFKLKSVSYFIPVFLILTSVLRQPTPDLRSSVSVPHPRYPRKHHHFVSSQPKLANIDSKVFIYAYSFGWCVEKSVNMISSFTY